MPTHARWRLGPGPGLGPAGPAGLGHHHCRIQVGALIWGLGTSSFMIFIQHNFKISILTPPMATWQHFFQMHMVAQPARSESRGFESHAILRVRAASADLDLQVPVGVGTHPGLADL